MRLKSSRVIITHDVSTSAVTVAARGAFLMSANSPGAQKPQTFRELINVAIAALARKGAPKNFPCPSESETLVSRLSTHFDLDSAVVVPMVQVALQPEYRAVVDHHEQQH